MVENAAPADLVTGRPEQNVTAATLFPPRLMDTPLYYSRAEYIETVRRCKQWSPESSLMLTYEGHSQDTGNKVSRRATIAGPQNIILGGKTIIANGAIIRGDLRRTGPGHAVVISLGRYCLVGEGCVMRCVAITLLLCSATLTLREQIFVDHHTKHIVAISTIIL